MHQIRYHNDKLYIEKVSISDIAKEVNTPFYCYSSKIITDNYKSFAEAAKNCGLSPLICFAVKANSNLAVLKILSNLGAGADCVSEGEIRRALKADIDSQKIVFSGVGKTSEEITFALENNILQFNVESEEELLAINKIAGLLQKKAQVALRINPDVDAGTHEKITTGKKENKFGIDYHQAEKIFFLASALANINVQGISIHIGSQIMELSPYEKSFDKIIQLYHHLTKLGFNIQTIDLGGGLGASYTPNEVQPSVDEYMRLIADKFANIACKIILEPGRRIIANAGILVTKVLYNKQASGYKFVIIDAGMNDLLRPSFYNSYHEIVPVTLKKNNSEAIVDVVGPVCESSDFFAKRRPLPLIAPGDLLAIKDVGAYGVVMASNYNTRLPIMEILVKNNMFLKIKKTSSYEEIFAKEVVPEW